jgi:hypothetical protein
VFRGCLTILDKSNFSFSVIAGCNENFGESAEMHS